MCKLKPHSRYLAVVTGSTLIFTHEHTRETRFPPPKPRRIKHKGQTRIGPLHFMDDLHAYIIEFLEHFVMFLDRGQGQHVAFHVEVLGCNICTSDHKTSILWMLLLFCPSTTKSIHILSPCASVTPFKIVRPKLLIASAISRK